MRATKFTKNMPNIWDMFPFCIHKETDTEISGNGTIRNIPYLETVLCYP
jgi:hypothetical protein